MKKWKELDTNGKCSVAITVIYVIWLIGYTIWLFKDYIAPMFDALSSKCKKLASKFRRKKTYSEVEI